MKSEKDVFISYAHLDDKPLDEGAKGWISDFHRLLETRLEQTIGYEINIWRDEKLSGNEVFAPEIESQLPLLKIMVSVITPRYLSSDWCRRELGAFYKAAAENGGVSIGNKSRIFKIMKTPVDRDVIAHLPDGISKIFDEILDYKFYIQDTATGKFKELSRGSWVDNKIKQEYMNKLEDVVQDMANLIKKLNSSGKSDVEKKKIYLAETTYDLQIYRDNLARELQEGGFAVLPAKNLPNVINRYTEEVEKYLDESILSVHLISTTNYAAQPEGADKSTVILQNEIAAQKSETGNLSRLIWTPPAEVNAAINPKMLEQQKSFIEELKTNPAYQKGADILEGPLEELKQAIFDTIRRLAAEEKAKEDAKREAEEKAKKYTAGIPLGVSLTAKRDGPKLVYLICDQRDLDHTRPIEDLVNDNGHEILLPLFDGDQAQLRQAHLDNLKICDAVIIYYGAANYRWAGSMKSDLMRLPALGRTKPLLDKAVYIAGPADNDKGAFKAIDLQVINGINGFSADLFSTFIQRVNLPGHE
ncbi:MAG TPA: TIR domain-containing protein [Ferruginibacter sp.]|nr:TIR domain-containing protein [Ferruginibacter sp.]